MWVEHPDYQSLILEHWHAEVYGSSMYILCWRLKLLKGPLKQLNKLHFSHISERVCRAEAALEQHQSLLQEDRDNVQLLTQDIKLRLELVNLKSSEKMFYSQKLKCNFFKDSDRGTSFFHALMNQKYKKNFIPAIHRADGSLTTSVSEVGDVFVSFFKQLLGTARATSPLDESVISCGPRLDPTLHSALLATVTNDDIKKALFSIGNTKSPGPDGYSSLFFKNSWDVVGQDVCAAVRDFFQSGQLLKQTNHCIIALVPKTAHVSFASDFRPLSCCNVVYKIISKILADRMGRVLDGIISPMQNAFLGGRHMGDNINLLQELLRQYERKRTSPRCIIKIDFRKAFDSVQWHFLRHLLLLLGFPDRFVHLVMTCVETASYSVAVNGELFGFFPGKCGVRQGDPLSPYLFIICMEYLSRMLCLASQNPSFRFHPKGKPFGLSHLSFADDIILLCRGDRNSVQVLFQQLILFGQTSGLDINISKSSIFFGGVADHLKQTILLDTGFSEGSFPFRYLGVPLSPHRLLASQYSPLLHKLEATIQGWMGKHLTYAGRLELIKSVLYGMVQFWVSIFPMPCAVIKQITCLC
jgi:mannosylglycoprotein endo-beta-mannosidase